MFETGYKHLCCKSCMKKTDNLYTKYTREITVYRERLKCKGSAHCVKTKKGLSEKEVGLWVEGSMDEFPKYTEK